MSGSINTNCYKTRVCRGNTSLQSAEGSGPSEGKLVREQHWVYSSDRALCRLGK